MIVLSEIAAASLALWAAVEVLHHGALFQPLRARIEARGGLLSDLCGCAFCLAHWVAVPLTAATTYAVGGWDDELISVVCRSLIVWLASIRTANLANDLFHKTNRTPHLEPDLDFVPTSSDSTTETGS